MMNSSTYRKSRYFTLRSEIETFIVENQMTSYTFLHGSQSHERVIDELQKTDLLIVPSVTASDGDTEGGSALLSDERDDSMLAKNILEVLRDPQRRSRMGDVGRQFVEQHHDVSSQIATLEEIYGQLAEDRFS